MILLSCRDYFSPLFVVIPEYTVSRSASGNNGAVSSYLAISCRWRKISKLTSSRVVGYCVGSDIFTPLFVVATAAAAAIVASIVIAVVAALLFVVIVVATSPPIVVFSGVLRIVIFRRYCSLLLFPS